MCFFLNIEKFQTVASTRHDPSEENISTYCSYLIWDSPLNERSPVTAELRLCISITLHLRIKIPLAVHFCAVVQGGYQTYQTCLTTFSSGHRAVCFGNNVKILAYYWLWCWWRLRLRLLSPSAFYSSLMFWVNVETRNKKLRLKNERLLYYYRSPLLVDSWVLCILRRNRLTPALGEISVSLQNVPMRPSISQESVWKNFLGLILFMYVITLYISSDIKKVSNNV